MEEFNIIEKNNNDVVILYLEGFLDAHTSVELEKSFERLISESKYKIIVNFEKLSYISSAGLGVFMAYIEAIRNNSGDIKLCKRAKEKFGKNAAWNAPSRASSSHAFVETGVKKIFLS